MDIIPPFRSVTDTVREIADLITNFRTCQDEWKQFLAHIQNVIMAALQPVNSTNAEDSNIKKLILALQGTLDGIVKKIRARQKDSILAKMSHFRNHSVAIDEMRREVDNAIEVFRMGMASWTGNNVEKLVQSNATRALDPLLNKLQYVSGASWDKHRVCLPNTRQHVIEGILSWVNRPVDQPSDTTIFLLTGVAGSGKSAIAHTIAKRLYETNQLATSFFFDRETAERNNPRWLISTIVFDLCQRNDLLARRIPLAIEEDKGLIGAPISRQFQRLILEPSQGFTCSPPLVIVLDALDEACDIDLLQILIGDASKLPPSIRIVVTSRMSLDIDTLSRESHVYSTELDIYNQENTEDISLFICSKLKEVANSHRLGDDWPSEQLVALFQARAEGLFLWVSTICAYLKSSYYPTKELEKLVSGPQSRSSAESKMDNLYLTILNTCNWDDDEFAESCRTLLGAAVATKSPLTLGALNALYKRIIMDSEPALRQLSPLLTGLSNNSGSPPVRFLHQSLRDFLTLRAVQSNDPMVAQMFAVDEKRHSRTLGLLCLEVMNRDLCSSMPGVGYCSESQSNEPGIPLIQKQSLSAELTYACRFWIEHIVDLDVSVAPHLLEPLERFLRDKLVIWMELTAACGRYEGISKIFQWSMNTLNQTPSLYAPFLDHGFTAALHTLAERLQYMDRREEALVAIQDKVLIYRNLECQSNESQMELAQTLCKLSSYFQQLVQSEDALAVANEAADIAHTLAAQGGDEYNWNLAGSLWRQSVAYTNVGRHDDAIVAADAAVKIQRELTDSGVAATTKQKSEYASSLYSLSQCFRKVGRYKDALETSTQVVSVYRELYVEDPPSFKSDLASSLHGLSVNHWQLGRYDEALTLIQEAVELGRDLVNERQATFTPKLAWFLYSLSATLGELGQHDEALAADWEALRLRRQLAEERPVVYSSDLAKSLHNLSVGLSGLGQNEEALALNQEAVELRRQLASERPAVFTPDLAQSLFSLAFILSSLGRLDEALAASQEAVALYRQLAKERPVVFTPNLIDTLRGLAFDLSNLGRDDEASEIRQEADDMDSVQGV